MSSFFADKVLLKRSTSGVEVKSCDGRGVSAMVETVADHASDLIDPSPLQSKASLFCVIFLFLLYYV